MRDARFRRKILIEAQQMVQELDEIEDQLERFREFDQPAFEVWQTQLFGPELRRKAKLEQEYIDAVEFHNSVVKLARAKHLSMARAFELRRQLEPEREAFTESVALSTPDQTPFEEIDATAAEQLKIVYRKFVRRLHPDRFTDEDAAEASERRWQKRLWNLAQAAREEQNVRRLEQLYRVALVRLMDFSELTLNDAHDVYAWLRVELEALRRARAEAAAEFAWDFSRRSDLRPLRTRVARRLAEEIEFLDEQLSDVRGLSHELEELAHRRPRRRRPQAPDTQLSFFD